MSLVRNTPRGWSEIAYAGERRVPSGIEPNAGSWPTYYLKKSEAGLFTDCAGRPVSFAIRHPGTIDFEGEQLQLVKDTIECLSQDQICIAEYWNAGPPTKQWTPVIDKLSDHYDLTPPAAARVLAATQAAINDALVMAWYFKYLWDVARPNQLDRQLATILCTPKHPSYPSGHATAAGCAEVILSHFFPPEAKRLNQLAEECAVSRLYGGVHYPADNEEGLRLGRQIGQNVATALGEQYDGDHVRIEYLVKRDNNAKLPPPPYKQVIGFPRERVCDSIIDVRECPSAR